MDNKNLIQTIEFINSKTNNFKPEIAIVLGSGLGCFCDGIEGINLKYADIPNFGESTVKGHKGELLFCEIEGKKVVIMQGRFHYYEGNSMYTATYPIKVFKKLGIKTLILTNAAGALHKGYTVGDIALITDHINFMGNNPLIGKNDDDMGERFPDMSDCYSKNLRKLAFEAAKETGLDLKQGVYMAVTGPSYETAAEVRAYKMLGADIVGMSTAPEAIVANWAGINTLGFSLVTNYGTGVSEDKLSHQEVIEGGKKAAAKLSGLLRKVIAKLD